MEQIDLSKLTLQETGLYNSAYAFSSIFRKNNITLVSQALDEKLMSDMIDYAHNSTKNQLRGFISLLKYKYLNIPIVSIETLDNKCKDNLIELYSMGCNLYDLDHIRVYLKRYVGESYINIENLSQYKLIDILKAILPFCNLRLKLIVELLIKNYDEIKINNQIENTVKEVNLRQEIINKEVKDSKLIETLTEELNRLIALRNKLGEQIIITQQKLDVLLTEENKDNFKK